MDFLIEGFIPKYQKLVIHEVIILTGLMDLFSYDSMADKPIDRNLLLDGLHDALNDMWIDAKVRGIVFHSLELG